MFKVLIGKAKKCLAAILKKSGREIIGFLMSAIAIFVAMCAVPIFFVIWVIPAVIVYIVLFFAFRPHINPFLWIVGYFFLTALIGCISTKRRLRKIHRSWF